MTIVELAALVIVLVFGVPLAFGILAAIIGLLRSPVVWVIIGVIALMITGGR